MKENYDLALVAMDTRHLDALHRLSVSVGWPHRKEDWASNLEAGNGVVAVDESDRVHGSAMYFPYGKGLSAVGMVICHPRLGRSGMKDALARVAFEQAGNGEAFLNACHDDVDMFRTLSARRAGGVFKCQGRLSAAPPSMGVTRPYVSGDHAQIARLDGVVYRADRGLVLRDLLKRSEARVVERKGEIRGFALRRAFGRGHIVGPVVADGDADAIALVAALLADFKGQFVRVDTRVSDGRFVDFLLTLGLRREMAVTTMLLGRERVVGARAPAYALSGHSTG